MVQKAKNNFFSTYIGSDFSVPRAKDMLNLALEELAAPKITTEFGRSQDSGLSNATNYSPISSKTPATPAPAASIAQAQEILKQKTPQQAASQGQNTGIMDQKAFDALQDAAPGSIKQAPDGSLVVKGTDGKFYYYNKNVSPGSQTPQQQPLVQNKEYDFLDASLFEESDIVAPIDTINTTAPTHVPTIKLEIEVKVPDSDEDEDEDDKKEDKEEDKKDKDTKDKEDDEDTEEYDELASLPPLDLSNDIHKAVQDAQQDMMPNIRVLPTDIQKLEVMRDGPIGKIKSVGAPSKIRSIEDDPYGLSVVGMDNDMALRLM